MLSAILFIGALVASGAQAQVQNVSCVAQSNGVTYQFCGRFMDFNLYWTFRPGPAGMEIVNGSLALIFEVPDNGYHAMGFSDQRGPGVSMLNSRVAFGCFNFNGLNENMAVDFLMPGDRVLANIVAAATGGTTQTLRNLQQTRMNGICAIRFERDAQPANVEPTKFIANGELGLVFARGPANAPAQHTERGFALVNLANGTSGAVGMIQRIQTPTRAPGAASIASLSQLVPAAVASLLFALW